MPATTSTKLKLSAGGGTVEIGGHDVSESVGRLMLANAAGEVPHLTLDLIVLDSEVEGEMTVSVSAATRAALIALGWTPPEDA